MQSTKNKKTSNAVNQIQENQQYSQPNTGKSTMQSTQYNKNSNAVNQIQ
jgi:hypothetical protein